MTEHSYSLEGKRVWVAGHRGMVGAAIVERLANENCAEILTTARSELDLTRQENVEEWVKANRPDAVFVAAAKVGGFWQMTPTPMIFFMKT